MMCLIFKQMVQKLWESCAKLFSFYRKCRFYNRPNIKLRYLLAQLFNCFCQFLDYYNSRNLASPFWIGLFYLWNSSNSSKAGMYALCIIRTKQNSPFFKLKSLFWDPLFQLFINSMFIKISWGGFYKCRLAELIVNLLSQLIWSP